MKQIPPVFDLWTRFRRETMAVIGLGGIVFLFLVAVYAPILANGRPFVLYHAGRWSFPFLHFIFAPDSTEVVVEKIFNYLMFFLPLVVICRLAAAKLTPCRRYMYILIGIGGIILSVPFLLTGYRLEKRDWRQFCRRLAPGEFALFAPVPYGPSETLTRPYEKPSEHHLFGTDQVGRDVLSRMIYGARVSLAVGILATAIAMVLGIIIGMISGYYGGRIDLMIMRLVEIIICFPTFLLLLILMAIMMDYKCQQSILMVVGIIGITGWTGLCRLIRGEVLKLRALPYIQSCTCLGIPAWRVMLVHLLPNITGIIAVNFTFSVAGAIIAESGLSFLGFGVQPPTASWGELLRQAFVDPFGYWHLTLWPGLALFIAVTSFNFAGEGLRRAFDPAAA